MSDPLNTSSYSEDEPQDLPLQLVALDGWHRARGAIMGESGGYDMPLHYGDSTVEQDWVRRHAALTDISHMGQISLTGEGVEQALAGVAGFSPDGLNGGQIASVSIQDEEDDLDANLLVQRRADDLYILVSAADKYDVSAWLFGVLPDDATITLVDEQALLLLTGPTAADVLAEIVPSAQGIGVLQGSAFDWQGQSLWISQTGTQTQNAYEISLSDEAAALFANALCGIDGVKLTGLNSVADLARGDVYHPLPVG